MMGERFYLDRFLVMLVVALCCGIGAALWVGEGCLWVGVGLFVVLFVFWRGNLGRLMFGGVAFGVGCLLVLNVVAEQRVFVPFVGDMVTVEGVVESSFLGRSDLVMAVERIEGNDAGGVLLAVRRDFDDEELYRRGERVLMRGILAEPRGAVNPGGFDERGYWRSQGVFYRLEADGGLRVIGEAQGLARWVNDLRERLLMPLAEGLSEEHYRLVLGILFGEKGMLDSDFYSEGQKLGIAHVFAVSGLHIGFVAALVLGILAFVGLERSYWAAGILAVVLTVYCIMTNLAPSAIRASVMAVAGLLSARWLRFRDVYSLLALAAAVILVYNPFLLLSVGFQLSFVSTWGLVYFYRPVAAKLAFVRWKWLRNALAVSLAAQAGSLPVTAYYFYLFSPLSPVANLLAVPLIGLIVPLVLLAAGISFVLPIAGEILLLPAEGLLYLLVYGLEGLTALWGTGHIYVGKPPLLAVALYFALLIAWREGWFARKVPVIRLCGALLAVVMVSLWLPNAPKTSEVAFLDVGQSSSAVVRLASGETLVFDGGLSADATANFLRYHGVNRVTAVVLSHADDDHSGGVGHLLRDFAVAYFFLEESAAANEAIAPLLQLAKVRGTEVVVVRSDLTANLGAENVLRLRPRGVFADTGNSRQLVAVLESAGRRLVFPGDLPLDDLVVLAKGLPPVDIWAVPHHGSRNSASAALYERLSVGVAVISAGRDNRYGHPHDETLAYLQAKQIPYWRTDQAGCVTVMFSPQDLRVKCHLAEQ